MAKAKKIGGVVAKAVTATFVNPFRVGGNYHACVAGMMALGMDRMHDHAAIVKAVRAEMFTNWKAFASKEARNENGKDANARIIQNLSVLKRNDYGAPLRELSYEVRFDGREKTAGLFKIGRAVIVKPTTKKAPESKPAAKKAKPAAKAKKAK